MLCQVLSVAAVWGISVEPVKYGLSEIRRSTCNWSFKLSLEWHCVWTWKNSAVSRQFLIPWSLNKQLTHWGQVMHICFGNLTTICSDNDLLPGRCQAIIWTNAAILLIVPLWSSFSGILIKIQTFSFKKMHFKMSPGKYRPFCLGLNVLKLLDCMCKLVWMSVHSEQPVCCRKVAITDSRWWTA